jgi:hypothetical protein
MQLEAGGDKDKVSQAGGLNREDIENILYHHPQNHTDYPDQAKLK